MIIDEEVICACGHTSPWHAQARHEKGRICQHLGCQCQAWRPLPSVLERLSVLEARLEEVTRIYGARLDMHVKQLEALEQRVEWLRGIALERAGLAEDVELVRKRLAKLFAAEDGHEVRAAFERLVTRLTEHCE